MAEYNEIVKLAIDAYKGTPEKYSVAQSQEALRNALIELNGGSTKLDYRAIRDGKCAGLFTIIEEILNKTVVDGLMADDFFMSLVDFRNVAEGDQNKFVLEDALLFMVDSTAAGTQGIRRQRILGETEVTVKTQRKVVRIYEELSRVLAGRVDFNHLIDVVAESFRQQILLDAYTAWSKVTAAQIGGAVYFPVAGNYSEDDLLDVIAHVEAASGGKSATILGTKKALKKLMPAVNPAEAAKEAVYNDGYVGKFYGSNVVAMPQRHKAGTTTFALNDKSITIVAGDEKPIKFVYEGDPLVIYGDPLDNADLTQEYLFSENYGLAIAVAGGNAGIGRYDFTN